ncbi:MAG TPA: dATP/dGTP diphosphohydrolase domain-containing protein [Gammaproteobacteria bacterium]|nr:dATP/dGTP diphosphohydrolase domain-containing protein [Gammaproteobacteria bacterium]
MTDKSTNPKDAVGVRKAPMSTVPANVIAELGVAMLEGASKYGRHNYRAMGVRSSVYYDGTMRHLMAWWEGEDIDPDSNLSHITKAIASLTVLRDAMMQDMLTDDRPPKTKPFYPDLNSHAAMLVDKHVDKQPKHYTLRDVLRIPKEPEPKTAPPACEHKRTAQTTTGAYCLDCGAKASYKPVCPHIITVRIFNTIHSRYEVQCKTCGAVLGSEGAEAGCSTY